MERWRERQLSDAIPVLMQATDSPMYVFSFYCLRFIIIHSRMSNSRLAISASMPRQEMTLVTLLHPENLP